MSHSIQPIVPLSERVYQKRPLKKTNLKPKSKANFNIKNLFKTLFHAVSFSSGLVFLVLLIMLFFFTASKAKAAEINLDLAKKVIDNVVPVVAPDKVDENSAAFAIASTDYISKPLVAETKITLEPKIKPIRSISRQSTISGSKTVASGLSNHFPFGYCTYYAASKRNVTWSGNASSWLSGARSAGLATGDAPQAGAIVVTSEGGRTGHVGIVEQVSGDQMTVSEMNYKGWGIISSRTISASYGPIRGYIY